MKMEKAVLFCCIFAFGFSSFFFLLMVHFQNECTETDPGIYRNSVYKKEFLGCWERMEQSVNDAVTHLAKTKKKIVSRL
jgi:hypothetical protein